MKPSEPPDPRGESEPQSSRFPATAAAADFAWPPSTDDLEGCGIVRLEDATGPCADLSVFVNLSDLVTPTPSPVATHHSATIQTRQPTSSEPTRETPTLTMGGQTVHSRRRGTEPSAEYLPFRVDGSRAESASSSAETWRAVVAVAAGLSLAVLSYSQFRGSHGVAPMALSVVAEAGGTLSDDRGGPEPVMDPPPADADERGATLPLGRLRGESARPFGSSVVHEPPRSVQTVATASSHDEAPPLVALASPVSVAVLASVPVPTPASASMAEPRLRPDVVVEAREPAAASLPIARASAPVATTAAYIDPVPGEEDHIRAALTRWRTAYSSLDANAARDVWPSVDARALERAFQALKSQDLRFDRCDLTVHGGSAQAACSGRAVYVPRVGNQSPRDAAREWTFELKKLDERWTIASARAS